MAGNNGEIQPAITSDYNREAEFKAFDESKSGVKGLVDAGIAKLPRMFIHPKNPSSSSSASASDHQYKVPIIDLSAITADDSSLDRSEVVNMIRDASENWGFFQVINHGIPKGILDEMVEGVRGFHEMETEEKMEYYSRDLKKEFIYHSNTQLNRAVAASWSDVFLCPVAPNPQSQQLPPVCRHILVEYNKHIVRLGLTLLELFSEALGLKPNHLKDIGCCEWLLLTGYYYPACPEPELTMGAVSHTDSGFFTIILQDLLGGLQILHQNQWVSVDPLPGALVVNIADLLQLITNDKFKSVYHRVLAQKVGPRISLVGFFRPYLDKTGSKVCKPIKELLSEENPAIYRETSLKEYVTLQAAHELDEPSRLAPFKVASMKV